MIGTPARLFLTSFIVSITVLNSSAATLDSWVEISKPNPAVTFTSVAYGDGMFVAVGDGGAIITSPDGAAWTAQASGVTTGLQRVKFVNGRFFAFPGSLSSPGQGTETLVSTNGTQWDKIRNLADITYANGAYFAVSQPGGSILRSVDLQNWEEKATWGEARSPHTIDTFSGKLVTWGALPSPISWSNDGITWNDANLPTSTPGGARWTSPQGGILFAPGTAQVTISQPGG